MPRHSEKHLLGRIGWLRAAVLGANDGIVSTASLIIGVAAANVDRDAIIVAGVAGLVAGAMSMAAGEYVSVSSQADAEAADLAREREEIANDSEAEHTELAGIYRARGLDAETAAIVARQLMAGDALGAHARDELGIYGNTMARPFEAALASALAFTVGAGLPLAVATFAPANHIVVIVALASLGLLLLLGAVGAWAGGAPIAKPMLRVGFWGALAMAITAGIGNMVGSVV